MKKRLDILRRADGASASYRQVFIYETEDARATVATALREINHRKPLLDADGKTAAEIRWECSCLQKKCGACAMVIDGTPRLACDTRLRECPEETIRIEPLGKFPVIADLMVDRAAMFARLRELGVWFSRETTSSEEKNAYVYDASRCLQCGCCLEVCPNFYAGGRFSGAAAAVPLTRILSQVPDEQKKEIRRSYRKGVYDGCGKSLACHQICPAGIDIERLMVRSNAAAAWRRL